MSSLCIVNEPAQVNWNVHSFARKDYQILAVIINVMTNWENYDDLMHHISCNLVAWQYVPMKSNTSQSNKQPTLLYIFQMPKKNHIHSESQFTFQHWWKKKSIAMRPFRVFRVFASKNGITGEIMKMKLSADQKQYTFCCCCIL